MKRKLFITYFIVAAFYTKAQDIPESFTLQEAIDWGMEYNRTLQSASMEYQKAHKEKWKTISIGFPQINANLQYQNNLEQPVSLIPAQFFGGNEGEFAEVVFGTKQTATGMVELNQLLFDGTYVVGVQGIRHYIETAANVLEKNQLEIKKAIITAYVNVQVAHENLKILNKNIVALENNLRETQALLSNGFVEEESVEQLRLTLSSLKVQINYTHKTVALVENVLNLLLGIDISKKIKLTETLEVLVTKEILEDKNTDDYSNNIDLRLAENNVTSESLLYRLERAKALPSFSAFLNGMYMGNSDTFTFTQSNQKWFGSSAFGLRVRVPIFSSLGRTASSQKAKLSLLQAETQLIETKAKVYVEWQNAKNNYSLAIDNFQTAKENVALAERIERKNTTKFFEGLTGSFELRQAQVQLYQAQQNLVQSMRQLILDKTTLETITNNAQ